MGERGEGLGLLIEVCMLPCSVLSVDIGRCHLHHPSTVFMAQHQLRQSRHLYQKLNTTPQTNHTIHIRTISNSSVSVHCEARRAGKKDRAGYKIFDEATTNNDIIVEVRTLIRKLVSFVSYRVCETILSYLILLVS